MKKTILLFAILFCVITTNARNFWTARNETPAMRISERNIVPQAYQVFALDFEGAKKYLITAPLEFAAQEKTTSCVISIPFPDGSFKNFAVTNSPIMQKGLALKYPEIKTYTGYGIEDKTASIKISTTSLGFHAMIICADATIFIDPYSKNNVSDYISYYRRDYFRNAQPMQCGFDAIKENETTRRNEIEQLKLQNPVSTNRSIGTELRTYRLALAANAEYTTFHGGTVAGALAAMVVSMNRVNGIYESEVDVRMVLVANTDTLIFLNSATDPYDNNDANQMLGANKTTCNARIGSVNYDIGHVFTTGGGGVAFLACVCGSDKAQGVTGTSSPAGDAFDVDYVAHEMGHQFGGNHTFNSVTGSCGGGNRSANAAYEPGSGVTIMGYAGICGTDNLAGNSIAYFHTKSFDEMVNFSQLSGGNSCAVITPTGNNPPVINQGLTYTIPFSTPFYLDGAATDPDGDTLTYSWEQFDLGPAGTWNAPTGNAPIFRSYAPSLTAKRYFPKLANVLANIDSRGEKKSSYARTLHFRLTARDNNPAGAGVTYTDTTYAVNVVVTTAPFAITYPNVIGISWAVGSTQTITWNVGGTDVAPINTPNVNIYLSTDSGKTYPVTLAANVPNSGAYTLVVPNNQVINGARVWVEGASNIFFDINDKNFSITGFVGVNNLNTLNNFEVYPNPSIENLTLNFGSLLAENCSIILTDAIGKIVREENVIAGKSTHNINLSKVSKGLYFVTVKSNAGSRIRKFIKG
jgi:Metallo-peptidase family M12B Reprolysin-like/Secretion system C-terminal sorting domain